MLMIEWLSQDRVFLYKRKSRGKDNDMPSVPAVKWEFVKRMSKMKVNWGAPHILEFVSPNFSWFLDPDTTKRQFFVRDMMTEEVVFTIPKHNMTFDDHPEKMLARFKWVNETTIKVISEEGMEVLLKLFEGEEIQQINFNQI